MNDTGRTTAVTFAALVLLLGALGALAAVTAERSVDGVLRAAEAFAGLGDHEAAALCRGVAERMR